MPNKMLRFRQLTIKGMVKDAAYDANFAAENNPLNWLVLAVMWVSYAAGFAFCFPYFLVKGLIVNQQTYGDEQ